MDIPFTIPPSLIPPAATPIEPVIDPSAIETFRRTVPVDEDAPTYAQLKALKGLLVEVPVRQLEEMRFAPSWMEREPLSSEDRASAPYTKADNPTVDFYYNGQRMAVPQDTRVIDGVSYINPAKLGLHLTDGTPAPDHWLPLDDVFARSLELRTYLGGYGFSNQPQEYYPFIEHALKGGHPIITDAGKLHDFLRTPPDAEANLANPDHAYTSNPGRNPDDERASAVVVAEGINTDTLTPAQLAKLQSYPIGWEGVATGSHIDGTVREVQGALAGANGRPDLSTTVIPSSTLHQDALLAHIDGRDPTNEEVLGDIHRILKQPGAANAVKLSLTASELMDPDYSSPVGVHHDSVQAQRYKGWLISEAREAHEAENGSRGVMVTIGSYNKNQFLENDNMGRLWHDNKTIVTSQGTADAQDYDSLSTLPGEALHRLRFTWSPMLTGDENRLSATANNGQRDFSGSSELTPRVTGALVDQLRSLPEFDNLPPEYLISVGLVTADPVGFRRVTNRAGFETDPQAGAGKFDPHDGLEYEMHDAGGAEQLVKQMLKDPVFAAHLAETRDQHLYAAQRDLHPLGMHRLTPDQLASIRESDVTGKPHLASPELANAIVVPLGAPQAISDFTQRSDGQIDPVPDMLHLNTAINIRHTVNTVELAYQLTPEQMASVSEEAMLQLPRFKGLPSGSQNQFTRDEIRELQKTMIAEMAPDFYFVSPAGTVHNANTGKAFLDLNYDPATGQATLQGILGTPLLFGELAHAGQSGTFIAVGKTPEQVYSVPYVSSEYWGPEQGAAYNPFEQADFLQAMHERSYIAHSEKLREPLNPAMEAFTNDRFMFAKFVASVEQEVDMEALRIVNPQEAARLTHDLNLMRQVGDELDYAARHPHAHEVPGAPPVIQSPTPILPDALQRDYDGFLTDPAQRSATYNSWLQSYLQYEPDILGMSR